MMTITRASLFLVFIIFIWCGCTTTTTNAASVFNNHKAKVEEDDLYWILGVKKRTTATIDDIQKAYRQRAKETHPDKNSSPQANEEFRRVVAAFEILSNHKLRKQYDVKYYYQHEQRKRKERHRTEMKRLQAEKERRERQRGRADMINRARLTYGDMVKVGTTMEEFQEKMLDQVDHHHHHQLKKKYTYRTHCLIMFVSNKYAEKVGEEDIHFPYPFAGEVGLQQQQQKKKNNPYANVLQVTKIRFNSQTDLTKHFGAMLNSNTPHIIFGKKGNDMNIFQVFQLQSETRTGLSAHNQFKKFVDSLYCIQVTVTNMYSLPVDVFIMRNDSIIHKDFTFDSGYQQSYLSLHAGDRIFAFDTRLDTFPGATKASFHDVLARAKEVLLLDVVVTTDTAFMINKRHCVDLSTRCHSWTLTQRGSDNNGQCTLNPEFMHNICPYTCGVCTERRYWTLNNISYHDHLLRLLHMFPQPLHMGLFAFGLLVVFNIVLFRYTTVAARRSYSSQQSNDNLQKVYNVVDPMVALRQRLNLVLETIPILAVGSIYALLSWIVGSSANEIPSCLTGIRSDIIGISKYSDISTLVLIAALIAGIYLRSLLSCINRGDMEFYYTVFFIFVILTIICAILTAITLAMDYNTLLINQWQYLLQYHKNAATLVAIIGAFTGVGLVSIHRLLLKPFRVTLESVITSLSFSAMLSHVIILAALGGLAFACIW